MWCFLPISSLIADRVLKKKAREGTLPDQLTPSGGVVFQRVENAGLAGSTFRDYPQLVKWLPAISLCTSLPDLLKDFKKQSDAGKCGLSLLLAGSLSNVLDRFSRSTVTDMLRFPKAPGKIKTLVFNLADFMILFGALLTLLFHKSDTKR